MSSEGALIEFFWKWDKIKVQNITNDILKILKIIPKENIYIAKVGIFVLGSLYSDTIKVIQKHLTK